MTRIFTYLVRFAVIIFGYALAALAASLFLNLVVLGAADVSGDEAHAVAAASLFVSIPLAALFISYYAFIPATVVILVCELSSRRGWLTYSLAGGGIALLIAVASRSATEHGNLAGGPGAVATVIGAGLFAGLVYWLAAGRSAGGFLGPRRVEDLTSPAR